ncbi:hypothetical protein PQ465_07185 [Sphingobacterium oryzagri]|uniref:Lipoprotein n=1 Tax=Sphingobacterium oryzagri TaxID=3025669 RepID=A0ABY7WP06_9SPHI|nr:hypothetical protein [Sphingobacterium sp. KACC 22765]WDF70153.1 hypothetical protein PQ465_07185 [Sphingobacterium sp. KACC 22765]
MKKLALLFVLGAPLYFSSCGNDTEKKVEGEESTPGPVTEMDKSRYNLNSTDEPLYGTTDTLKQDSLQKADSLRKINE